MQDLSIVMPKMGESVMEATIIKWLKQEGDMVAESESILEVATDKVDSDIPAPYSGRLKKILVSTGTIIAIGTPIAIIEVYIKLEDNRSSSVLSATFSSAPLSTKPVVDMPPTPITATTQIPLYDTSGRFYSPLVRHIAAEEQISYDEMCKIPGTGKNNRVTKDDLLSYLAHRKKSIYEPSKAQPLVSALALIQNYARPGDEIIAMDRVRKLTAERMVSAMQTIPHVTSFVEADVTNIVTGKIQYEAAFKAATGISLTYTPMFIKAVAYTIKIFPMINVSVQGEYIIKHQAINIGLAVALPNGNLIVPVVRNVDQLSLTDLTFQIHQLVHKARNYQLLPDDIADGTYTISNIGSFQNLMGTPIIMQPQVAILAVGAIVKKPVVIDDAGINQIVIRNTMYLSHTYDHRVIDGALGGQFVKKVADFLETFDIGRELNMC